MRSAMRAASQLPGRGLMLRIWPLYLHVNQNSDDDDTFRPTWCVHFLFSKIFTFDSASLFLCIFGGNAAEEKTLARPK